LIQLSSDQTVFDTHNLGALSPRQQPSRSGDDHPSPSHAETKSVQSSSFISQTPSWRGAQISTGTNLTIHHFIQRKTKTRTSAHIGFASVTRVTTHSM